MSGITVSRRGDDLIAVKPADPANPARRRTEGELLARIDHPGVVRFVGYVEGDPDVLQTGYVGTDTWQRTPPTEAQRVADALVSLATTVADLHDLGTTHGALLPEHVVVGADQRPILCGLADARPLDLDTAIDDMVGLAGLIRHLAEPVSAELRGELDELARSAASGAIDARALADALRDVRIDPSARPGPHSFRRRRVAAIVAAGAGAVLVIAVATALGADSEIPADSAPSTTTTVAAASEPSLTSTTTTAATTTTTSRSEPPATAGLEFVHEGRRYGLGAPGDVTVMGDWDCDGVETPALLQVDTGAVSIFDTWPEPGSGVPAAATSIIPTAIGLEAIDVDGCQQLRVLEPNGSHLFTPEI